MGKKISGFVGILDSRERFEKREVTKRARTN
jgi:hypothetical protein